MRAAALLAALVLAPPALPVEPAPPSESVLPSESTPPSTSASPYSAAANLFDASQPDLGLRAAPGTETFTIFSPGPTGDRFSNGVVLIPFRDRLYAQWQSSARD